MTKPVLTLDGLSKFYTSANNVVVGLNNISLSFCSGEFVAITGESGSGKSTLAHVIGGILPYESGELYFNGRPTSHFDGRDWEHYRRDHISFISQNYGILLSCTVLENVVSALRLTGMKTQDAHREAKAILEKVELWELRSRRAAKLSSGQKQRLSIARALAKPTPILIADEPTGNLDPENSAKIISLLAEAAKDRLVLLITHDFSEAEDLVTRRISLQDGKIVMDASLRPAPACTEPPQHRKHKKQLLSLYAARLQLTGRPVWGSVVLTLLALTAFAVFAFLGTFIVALDDTNTRHYDNSAFRNGDKTRIVVQRADGEPMTREDYDRLLSIRYVQSLERSGYIADVNCYYIKDQHYRASYYLVNVGSNVEPVYEQREAVEFLDSTHFAKTVPLLAQGSFLTAGRTPENLHEVVVAGDESRIGETFTIYFQDKKHWSVSYYIPITVTVVGVTNYGEGVYLHSDVGQMFRQTAMTGQWLYMPSAELTGDQIRLSAGSLDTLHVPMEDLMGQSIGWGGDTYIFEGVHEIPCPSLALISQEKYDSLFTEDNLGMQVSLTISDYAYTDRVLSSIQGSGYAALSPYRMGATTQIESLVTERSHTLIICAAVLLVVLVLQMLVLRAIFSSETENYRLLANIGLTCGTAQRSILWQVLAFTAAGQLVGFAALFYCNQVGIERIVRIIRYLPPQLMTAMSLVHLAAALIAAFWIALALRKRVYPMLIRRDDLKLDDEEAEV